MAIEVNVHSWEVPDIAVLVKGLRILQISVWDGNWNGSPVGRDEPPQRIRVVPSPEVIQVRFRISFLAGELVVIGVVVGKLQLTAPGVKIRFILDIALCVSND